MQNSFRTHATCCLYLSSPVCGYTYKQFSSLRRRLSFNHWFLVSSQNSSHTTITQGESKRVRHQVGVEHEGLQWERAEGHKWEEVPGGRPIISQTRSIFVSHHLFLITYLLINMSAGKHSCLLSWQWSITQVFSCPWRLFPDGTTREKCHTVGLKNNFIILHLW